MQPIDAVIVACRIGNALGTRHSKAFVSLAGKPLFLHSLERLDTHSQFIASPW